MTIKRVQYLRCSFVPPDNFEIPETPSPEPTNPAHSDNQKTKEIEPVCFTLESSAIPYVLESSEEPKDMDPNLFPVSITLSTLNAYNIDSPTGHLHEIDQSLEKCFDNYKVDFCKEDHIKEQPAARSQCSFETNFKIFRLNFAWFVEKEIVTTTMMVTKLGVQKGWEDLRLFVESVHFKPI